MPDQAAVIVKVDLPGCRRRTDGRGQRNKIPGIAVAFTQRQRGRGWRRSRIAHLQSYGAAVARNIRRISAINGCKILRARAHKGIHERARAPGNRAHADRCGSVVKVYRACRRCRRDVGRQRRGVADDQRGRRGLQHDGRGRVAGDEERKLIRCARFPRSVSAKHRFQRDIARSRKSRIQRGRARVHVRRADRSRSVIKRDRARGSCWGEVGSQSHAAADVGGAGGGLQTCRGHQWTADIHGERSRRAGKIVIVAGIDGVECIRASRRKRSCQNGSARADGGAAHIGRPVIKGDRTRSCRRRNRGRERHIGQVLRCRGGGLQSHR